MRLAFDLTSMCQVVFHEAAFVKSSGPVTGCQVLVFEEDLVNCKLLIPKQAPRKSAMLVDTVSLRCSWAERHFACGEIIDKLPYRAEVASR